MFFSLLNCLCPDINECISGTHSCDVNAGCTNGNGAFTCQCNTGYTGNGQNGQCTGTCIYKESTFV